MDEVYKQIVNIAKKYNTKKKVVTVWFTRQRHESS